MFVVVAVLMGLLAGGLVVPWVVMAGAGSRSAAGAVELLPTDLETPPQPERSRVLMSDGSVLATFYEQNRVYVPLEDIAPVMRQAQVAIEDHRFYEHGALDLTGTLRALLRNSAGGSTQGGSSLTQQYVKMVQVEKARASGDDASVEAAQEKTYRRKLQELRYALAVEERLSKDEILERYLNIAYFGDGAYGVEQAARQFFGTSAADLDLAQAAMLAGLVQNPTATDPRRQPEAAVERRDVVINRMAGLGLVSTQAAAAARAEDWDPTRVRTAANGCVDTQFPFLCDYVRRTLLTDEALGRTEAEREALLEQGGLTIRTRIEPATQKAAEEAISDLVDPRDPVIATMTMVEPGTGQVLAMAQSRPEMGDGPGQTFYNYAVRTSLGGAEGFQAGSTFKAFTAAAALEEGISVQQRYDSPSRMDFSGQRFDSCEGRQTVPQGYRPKNSTRSGPDMTMSYAMAWSVNTYFLQLGRDTGMCHVTSMTERLGVELASGEELSSRSSVFSLPLGSVDITPLSMTEAYSTFAAEGVHCEPVVVQRITSRDGDDLGVGAEDCDRVVDRGVSGAVTGLLSDVMDGAGGPARPAPPGRWQDRRHRRQPGRLVLRLLPRGGRVRLDRGGQGRRPLGRPSTLPHRAPALRRPGAQRRRQRRRGGPDLASGDDRGPRGTSSDRAPSHPGPAGAARRPGRAAGPRAGRGGGPRPPRRRRLHRGHPPGAEPTSGGRGAGRHTEPPGTGRHDHPLCGDQARRRPCTSRPLRRPLTLSTPGPTARARPDTAGDPGQWRISPVSSGRPGLGFAQGAGPGLAVAPQGVKIRRPSASDRSNCSTPLPDLGCGDRAVRGPLGRDDAVRGRARSRTRRR
ncbi:Membrane carboxypeptidase (penicillin-binding protein) [Auraticoccus monumenti]|uniref:Membrane carboxypeptidase (Penicillin-binding protein) n=1 Tax=Auraticoccus monumenti TaxID=675864 RepID=A0A1G7BI88_9ACTN|nr:Membrane carboxypeptidase (penicillin-binding protein) [Auraticoccus monumenti]